MAKATQSKSTKVKVGKNLSGKKLILLIALVLAFAAGGVYYVVNSKAATGVTGGGALGFAYYRPTSPGIYHQVGNLVNDNGVTAWSSGTPGFMWYGPYRSLNPNNATNSNDNYYACFSYRVTSNNTNVRFDVSANSGASVLAVRNLTNAGYMSSYNSGSNTYSDNCLKFRVTSATSNNIEFRVIVYGGSIRMQQVQLNHYY